MSMNFSKIVLAYAARQAENEARKQEIMRILLPQKMAQENKDREFQQGLIKEKVKFDYDRELKRIQAEYDRAEANAEREHETSIEKIKAAAKPPPNPDKTSDVLTGKLEESIRRTFAIPANVVEAHERNAEIERKVKTAKQLSEADLKEQKDADYLVLATAFDEGVLNENKGRELLGYRPDVEDKFAVDLTFVTNVVEPTISENMPYLVSGTPEDAAKAAALIKKGLWEEKKKFNASVLGTPAPSDTTGISPSDTTAIEEKRKKAKALVEALSGGK